jgi:hypothetical protein
MLRVFSFTPSGPNRLFHFLIHGLRRAVFFRRFAAGAWTDLGRSCQASSAAKAADFSAFGGTTEVVPFPDFFRILRSGIMRRVCDHELQSSFATLRMTTASMRVKARSSKTFTAKVAK